MSEIYCEDCEMEIKLPSKFDELIGKKEAGPTKFRDGWRCVDCTKKRKTKGA